MKGIKIMSVGIAIAAIVVSAPAGVEKPNVMPEAMISITVSDLHGFLDEVGLVASKVSPMMSGEMMKGMIGGQINDPSLSGVPAGKGLSIVALDLNNYFAVLEVTAAQSTNYTAVMTGMGMQAEYANDALVVAQTPDALRKGVAALASVKSTLLSKRSPTLNIAAQPADLIELNKASIDMAMGMMPMMMAQGMMQQPGATVESVQSTTKILQGEVAVLLSLAEQCEVAELTLAPKGGSLEISKTFVAKAGTDLAKLVNAPVKNKANPAVHSGGFEGGTVLYDFHLSNPDALAAFFGVEMEKMFKALMIEDVDSGAIMAAMNKWMKAYGGSGCERVALGADGKMVVEYVMEARDEAAATDALKTMDKDLAPFFKLYESLGMPMSLSLKENARDAGGVKVHELRVAFEMDSFPEEQRAPMAKMGLDNYVYEVAVVDGLVYYSMPGGMEALVKRFKDGAAKSATPMKARTEYPANGFYYLDVDAGGYAAFVASMMPDEPETAMMKQQLATLFQGVPPVVSAGFKEGDRVMWSVKLPGELIAKWGQLAMMMQMQAMQQSMGGPGEVVVP